MMGYQLFLAFATKYDGFQKLNGSDAEAYDLQEKCIFCRVLVIFEILEMLQGPNRKCKRQKPLKFKNLGIQLHLFKSLEGDQAYRDFGILLTGLSMQKSRLFNIFSFPFPSIQQCKNVQILTPPSPNYRSSSSLTLELQNQKQVTSPLTFLTRKSYVLIIVKEGHYSSPTPNPNLSLLKNNTSLSFTNNYVDSLPKERDSRSSIGKIYQSLIIKVTNIIKTTKMSDIEQNAKHKKRYSKISTEKRIKLVQMVFDHGFTITRAAKLLHVKRPTAKIILKRYQHSGTFFNKRMPEVKKKDPEAGKKEIEVEKTQNECMGEGKEESVQLKVQQNEELSPQSTNPLGSFMPYTFVYYYQPFLDYHCFM